MSCFLRAALLGALGFSMSVRAEGALNCSGGIVAVGDSKIDLVGKCGDPALRDEREQPLGARYSVEQWTYNFGPNQFLRIVTIEQNRIVSIERGGHGYDPESIPKGKTERAKCESGVIKLGDLKLDLLAKCGEPRLKDVSDETRRARRGTNRIAIEVEKWTYDHGPQQFVEVVSIENGKVVLVERGNHGYAK